MTLATHIVIGASIAQFFPQQPLVVLTVSLLSHYLSDRIPHWDYRPAFLQIDEDNKLASRVIFNRQTWTSIGGVIVDLFLGCLLSYFLYYRFDNFNLLIFLMIVLGSILPDVLQFGYLLYKKQPLLSLQKFHDWCHHPKYLKIKNTKWGITAQISIIILFFLLQNIFLN